MADYILNNAWSDIDAVASAYRSGALVEKGKLYNPTERDILPVSAKSDGSLWSRAAMVYSFNSMSEYDEFINENTKKIKNGDHVWIKSMGLNRANVYTLYLYFQNGLNKAVEIVSNASTGSGESDDTGKGAVIWYTNVGPSSDRFAISDLRGPAGAVPVPGHMIVSSYTGMGYFITATDGAAVTVSSYKVQVTGSKGDTGPQGPGAELFKVTFSHTSGGYAADKTNAEIYAAAESGKMVVGLDVLGRMMQLYRYGSTFAWFTALGYDRDDEAFLTQVYRIENDSITVDFGGTTSGGGRDGTDAVIWYTNGGPHNNIFPIQSLMGPMNATPVPGHMIISNYTGLAYFITEINGDAAVFGDYTVQVKPNTSEIVSAVIAALPVYGGETQ